MGLGWALPEKRLVLSWWAQTRENERTALELNSLIMRTANVSPGLACVRHHVKALDTDDLILAFPTSQERGAVIIDICWLRTLRQ